MSSISNDVQTYCLLKKNNTKSKIFKIKHLNFKTNCINNIIICRDTKKCKEVQSNIMKTRFYYSLNVIKLWSQNLKIASV